MRIFLALLAVATLAGCGNVPIRQQSGLDYYNTQTTGGVGASITPALPNDNALTVH